MILKFFPIKNLIISPSFFFEILKKLIAKCPFIDIDEAILSNVSCSSSNLKKLFIPIVSKQIDKS